MHARNVFQVNSIYLRIGHGFDSCHNRDDGHRSQCHARN